MSQREEISSNPRSRKALFVIALPPLFLLSGIGLLLGNIIGGEEAGANILFVPQSVAVEEGVISAQGGLAGSGDTTTPSLIFLGNTSLVAVIPPIAVTPQVLGAIIGETNADFRQSKELAHYIVQEDDTVESIAEQFEVSVNTVLWANDLHSGSTPKPGRELIILPVSGALHLVRPGDTLSEVAVWYRGDVQEILDFNDLESAESIFVGDLLIIPGGRKPSVVPAGRLTPLANSYFIYPVPRSYKLTQGIHPFNAVDLSNGTCGEPVYAAAGGMVQRAGYHSIAGNYVRILHPNGVVTFYGHLSGQTVSPGEKVLQGAIVGYGGHSGHTIPAGPGGCHLHFEVRGATNPFAK